MKTCEKCGAPNNDENAFCIGCGSPMKAVEPSPEPAKPSDPAVSYDEPAQQPRESARPSETERPFWPSAPEQSSQPVPPVMPSQPVPPPVYGQQPYYPQQPPYQQPPAAYPYTQPAGNPYAQPQPPYGYTYPPVPVNSNAALNLRALLSSPFMLALVILWAAQVILSIITGAMAKTAATEILSQSGFGDIFRGFSSMNSGVSVIFEALPSALIVIGLFMAYNSAKNVNQPLKTSGFTMIRVITIIEFVFVCIGLGALLIISFVVLGGNNAFLSELIKEFDISEVEGFSMTDLINVIGVALLFVALIAAALLIPLFIVLQKFLGSIIQTIRTGYPQAKGASAISVFAFIFGALAALGALGSLANIAKAPSYGLVSFLSSAAGAVLYFLVGILASKYKNAMLSAG